jgi:DMSO reductase family type II enzyme heme b subunit
MRCYKLAVARAQLLDPVGPAWNRVPGETLPLAATPLANQPSAYVRASRSEVTVGKVRSLMAQAAHDGRELFVRLSWEDASENRVLTDNDVFPDACGILMPLDGGDPPIDEMGSRAAPVNAWFWRADHQGPARNTIAHGLGTTRFTERSAIETAAAWGHGAWAIVFARPLAVPDQVGETVQLAPGTTVKIGFAIWEGNNGERAGLKSFSREWRPLEMDA